MEPKETNKCNQRHGFSLVELLVAMAIAGVVMAAVFKIYTTQQDSYLIQEQIAEMQHNSRIAKYVLVRSIRMVGYNPTGKPNVGNFVTSVVARLPGDDLADNNPDKTSTASNSIAFTLDDNGDGFLGEDFDEQIAYRVTGGSLQRFEVVNDAWLTIVENIEAVGFAYAYVNDDGDIVKDGENIVWAIDSKPTDANNQLDVKLDGNGDSFIDAGDDTNDDDVIDYDDAGTLLLTPVDLDKIVAVKIWLLAKTGQSDRKYTRSETYVVGNRIMTINDKNRGLLLTTTVKCRNMAL